MTAERMSAEELERALAFLEHHERAAFPQRSESQAASSIRAHIAALQREAEAERARADAMREALQTISIGYVVAGGVIRDAAGGVMDYVEPEEKPLRAEVAQSIARAALSQARHARVLEKEDGVWLHVRDGDKSTLSNLSAFLDVLRAFEATLLLEHGSESEALLHWQERIAPMIERTETALSQARGEPEAPEQQSSAEWTDDDQANTDFVSDIACEISADDDVVHSVLGALTERNLFDWSAARKEIRTRYGEPSLSSEGK